VKFALCTFKALARAAAARSGTDAAATYSGHLQALRTAVRAADARAILRRGVSYAQVADILGPAAAVLADTAPETQPAM
jgi:hypothetical protein